MSNMHWPSDMREHRTEQAIKTINQLADHLLYDEISEYEQSKMDALKEAIELLQAAIAEREVLGR